MDDLPYLQITSENLYELATLTLKLPRVTPLLKLQFRQPPKGYALQLRQAVRAVGATLLCSSASSEAFLYHRRGDWDDTFEEKLLDALEKEIIAFGFKQMCRAVSKGADVSLAAGETGTQAFTRQWVDPYQFQKIWFNKELWETFYHIRKLKLLVDE